MKIREIEGGYHVPEDTHIGKWQIDSQRLDHDEYLVPQIVQRIPEGGCVIDCGAFNGDHAIAYARKTGPSGLVVAIEAGETAFTCLAHNAQLFSQEANVLCLNIGVGADYQLLMHHKNENLGASHLASSSGDAQNCFPIAVWPLDILFPIFRQQPLNLIKMDIEGMEVQALKGAASLIHQHRPTLVLEVNAGALQRNGSSAELLLELVNDLGYGIEKLPEDAPWDSPQYDIICTYNR